MKRTKNAILLIAIILAFSLITCSKSSKGRNGSDGVSGNGAGSSSSNAKSSSPSSKGKAIKITLTGLEKDGEITLFVHQRDNYEDSPKANGVVKGGKVELSLENNGKAWTKTGEHWINFFYASGGSFYYTAGTLREYQSTSNDAAELYQFPTFNLKAENTIDQSQFARVIESRIQYGS